MLTRLLSLLTLIPFIAANNASIIYIHEELPPNSLLLSSVSSTDNIQWLPSSVSLQPYFRLNQNQSLTTTDERLDREELCAKNLCNCSHCLLTLNFLQTFSSNNISIRTVQIVIEGKPTRRMCRPCTHTHARAPRSRY